MKLTFAILLVIMINVAAHSSAADHKNVQHKVDNKKSTPHPAKKQNVIEESLKPSDGLTKPEKKVVKSPIFHKAPLYYYHQYALNRNHVNPDVSLHQHYRNERKLRKEHFKIERKMRRLREELTFKTNDAKHAILGDENAKVALEAQENALERKVSQRHTALKFQIDHSMAWNEFYNVRRAANEKKLAVALPDQIPGLKGLISFDVARSKFYHQQAVALYETLKGLRTADVASVQDLVDRENALAGDIIKMKMIKETEGKALGKKMEQLKADNENVMSVLKSDDQLDALRRQNELIEGEAAAHGGLSQTEGNKDKNDSKNAAKKDKKQEKKDSKKLAQHAEKKDKKDAKKTDKKDEKKNAKKSLAQHAEKKDKKDAKKTKKDEKKEKK